MTVQDVPQKVGQQTEPTSALKSLFSPTVLICALGYFVDIYDLLLFSIVRVDSLRSLGFNEATVTEYGVLLLNVQMAGLMIGGIFWGILGDKKGRLSVLLASILTYSLANIANAFATNIETYATLRFIAGVGLAGELGAAITLVSELVSKEHRGYSTAIIAGIGLSGAVFAGLLAKYFSWRWTFAIGGVLGLVLLVTRVRLADSPMFSKMMAAHKHAKRGNPLALFTNWVRFKKFIASVAIGIPCWYIGAITVSFSPEVTKELGVVGGSVVAGTAVMSQYAGLVFGDLLSGLLCQWMKSRKRVAHWAIVSTFVFIALYLLMPNPSTTFCYFIYFATGFTTGYWAVFVTMASEQFGTNLRATVTTMAPNLVRGAVIPMTLAMQYLRGPIGLVPAVAVIGAAVCTISLTALWSLKDSYDFDLNYLENY